MVQLLFQLLRFRLAGLAGLFSSKARWLMWLLPSSRVMGPLGGSLQNLHDTDTGTVRLPSGWTMDDRPHCPRRAGGAPARADNGRGEVQNAASPSFTLVLSKHGHCHQGLILVG